MSFFPPGRIGCTESPFAEKGGFVSGVFFNNGCDRCFGKRQCFLSLAAVFFVSANVGMTGMSACQKRTAGGGRDGCSGIMVGEKKSLVCHAVDIGQS